MVVRPMEVLQRIKRVMMLVLLLLMTEFLIASRGYVFFSDLEVVVVQDSVTFPLVLVVRRGGRRRRLGVVFRNRFFVNGRVAFLVVIGRGEDAYGNRDAGFKVQVASLSDSPKISCRPNTT